MTLVVTPAATITAVAGTTRAGAAAARRRARRAEIVTATRALFDERGLRDANIDDIARAVGVNRAIIYRHFSSKDELFALTLARSLEELDARLVEADDAGRTPEERLAAAVGVLADYGLRHPAFVDCALALQRQPGEDLLAEISEGALFRLGQLLASTLGRFATVLAAGGRVPVEDGDLAAMALFLQALGVLHLARTGFFVRAGDSAPETVPVDEQRVRSLVVHGVLAAYGPTAATAPAAAPARDGAAPP